MQKRVIGLAATFVGTLIGAGFASGREIALYFSHTSPLTPLLSGACLGVLCFFFLELGRLYSGDLFVLFGKFKPVFLVLIRFFNAVVTCAMIAGGELVIYSLFGIHGGGIITGVITLITIIFGVEKLKSVNSFIVPAIVLLVFLLLFKGDNSAPFERFSVIPAFTYATMNIISGGYFISTLSKECSRKENLAAAIISGVVLSAMLICVYVIIQKDLNASMPLMAAAERCNLKIVGNIIMYLAIYTTITSSLVVASENNIKKAAIIIAACYLVSLFSFEKIIDISYPIMGVCGAAVIAWVAVLAVKKRLNDKSLKLDVGVANHAD